MSDKDIRYLRDDLEEVTKLPLTKIVRVDNKIYLKQSSLSFSCKLNIDLTEPDCCNDSEVLSILSEYAQKGWQIKRSSIQIFHAIKVVEVPNYDLV